MSGVNYQADIVSINYPIALPQCVRRALNDKSMDNKGIVNVDKQCDFFFAR